MHEEQIHLSEEPLQAAYAITLAPGNVKFLKFSDFLGAEVDVWIEALRKLSPQPAVSSPNSPQWKGLDLEAIDALCPGEGWDTRLRIHHALGKLYFQQDAPTYAYSSFHVGLLLNEYNYDEFIRAWVVDTFRNWKHSESLKNAPDHIVLVRAPGSFGYIFRKTPFVLARLAILSEEYKKGAEEAERQAKQRSEEAALEAKRLANDGAIPPGLLQEMLTDLRHPAAVEAKRTADDGAIPPGLLQEILTDLRRSAALEAKQRADESEREAQQRAQKAALRAAEEVLRRKGLSEAPSSSKPFYVITLAPGLVRYLDVALFLEADVTHWVDLIRGLCPQPRIQAPSYLDGIDELLPDLSWESRLRAHHALGRLNLEHGVPLAVYCCFHSELKLTALELDACLNAWVKEAWDNGDVEESFVDASDYLVLRLNASSNGRRCVFRKTPFVTERLTALDREAQLDAKRQLDVEAARKETGDLERLRKSNFDTFIYLMEDLRNGHFKIGRSRSPGKRERTLQSEVPQIVLRLSIPADEKHERELHDRFANKRLRGEWFSLAPDDLQGLVSFLRGNGDAARASIDYQWLGTIFFNAPNNPGAK